MPAALLRRVIVVACLVFAMLPLVPAAAATGGSSTRAGARQAALEQLAEQLPADATVAVGGRVQQHRSVTEIFGEVRNHRDLGAWLGSVAEVMARAGTPVTTRGEEPGEDSDGASESVEVEEPDYTGSYADAGAAGDLDGDGGNDILAYHYSLEDDSVLLEARRGANGAPLWERRANGDDSLAAPAGSDVNGDGADDLLELSIDILDEEWKPDCPEGEEDSEWGCWNGTYTVSYRWGLAALSGADGSQLWSKSYEGELTETSKESYKDTAEVVYEDTYEYSIKGTNVEVVPMLTDTDGNGVNELLVDVFDVEETEKGEGTFVYPFVGAGMFAGSYGLDARMDAELLDAATGAQSATFTEAAPGMYPFLYPIEQAGGDDLVLERIVAPDEEYQCVIADAYVIYDGYCTGSDSKTEFRLAVLDGVTHKETWSKTSEGWAASYPVGGDLDADGVSDLALFAEGDEDYTTTFLAGATGAALWSADSMEFVAVAPLDAKPGDDLVTAKYSYDEPALPSEEDSYTETMTLERRNGATGTAWQSQNWTSTSSESESGYTESYAYAAGGPDGNGDGFEDITVGIVTFEIRETEEDYTFLISGSDGQAQSGPDASVLYEAPDGPMLFPTGDFDGDGLGDLSLLADSYGDTGNAAWYRAVRMLDGVELWQTDAAADAVYFAEIENLDGDGAADLLQFVDVETTENHVSTDITLIDGTTGSPRWWFYSRP